jgi:1,2-diacylglycerol 3-alpha-glucosyltransferase
MINIAVVFTNYGPYHLSRVNSFSENCKKLGWEVVGVEMGRYEITYDWKTDVRDISFKLVSIVEDRPWSEVKYPNLLVSLNKTFSEINPDVIAIAGYFEIGMLFALFWSHWYGKKSILLSESTENDFARSWWKELIKSWIVKQFDAALVGGNPHKRYLVNLGFSAESIFLGYDVVGNENFHPDNIKNLPEPINKPYFLGINRFVTKKNLSFLISAYFAYCQVIGENAWHLVLCGNGELRPELEQQIRELNLTEFVHMPGFLQQHELLPYFSHASCFIHASIQEQWGLVVNEAMAAGLAVLISNRCGCYEDLIIEGVNGFGFDPENQEELTNLMIKMSSGDVDLESMGKASLQHIEKYSPDYFAQGLNSAIKFVLCQS